MIDQVFHLDDLKWQDGTPGSVGKFKMLLDSKLTKSGSLKIIQLKPKDKFESHEHNYLQLMYFTKGIGILKIDDHFFDIKPGLTAIVLPNQCHKVENTSDDESMDIMVFETYELADTNTPYVDF